MKGGPGGVVRGNRPHACTASEIREDILLGMRVLSTGVTLWLLGGEEVVGGKKKMKGRPAAKSPK